MPRERTFKVTLFEVQPAPFPGSKAPDPVQVPGFVIEARNLDGARSGARDRLKGQGYTVRSVNFSDKSGAMTAYVEKPRA